MFRASEHILTPFKSLGDKFFIHQNSVIKQNSQKEWTFVQYFGGVEYSTGPEIAESESTRLDLSKTVSIIPLGQFFAEIQIRLRGGVGKKPFIPLAYTTLECSSIWIYLLFGETC